jgi:hypothetical protein
LAETGVTVKKGQILLWRWILLAAWSVLVGVAVLQSDPWLRQRLPIQNIVEESIYFESPRSGGYLRLHVIRDGYVLRWPWQESLRAPLSDVCVMVVPKEINVPWPRMFIDAKTRRYVLSDGRDDGKASQGALLTHDSFQAWMTQLPLDGQPSSEEIETGYQTISAALDSSRFVNWNSSWSPS